MKAVYKLTAEEWPRVKEEMRAAMIAAARARRTITYGELAAQLETAYVHPHSFLMTRLLIEIGRDEIAAGRGVLPAVVVAKATGMPGGGYFRASALAGAEISDLETAWREDLEGVFAYWHEADTAR